MKPHLGRMELMNYVHAETETKGYEETKQINKNEMKLEKGRRRGVRVSQAGWASSRAHFRPGKTAFYALLRLLGSKASSPMAEIRTYFRI